MKKLLLIISASFLLIFMTAFISCAEAEYILTEEKYVSSDTVKKLDIKAKNIYREFGFGVYFVMTDEVEKSGAYEFSKNFYESNIKENGVVFCVDAKNSSCYIYGGDDIGESDRNSLMKAYTDADAVNSGERIDAYLKSAYDIVGKISSDGKNTVSNRLMPRFMDYADAVDDSLEDTIYADIDAFSEKNFCDVIFVIYSGNDKPSDYAEKYYAEYDFGFGESKDGVILAVCADTNTSSITAFGNSKSCFTDTFCADINAALSSYLESKDYIGLFVEYLEDLSQALSDKKQNDENTESGETQQPIFIDGLDEIVPRINDSADIISADTEEEVLLILDEVSGETGVDFAVLTIYDFPDGISAKEYARQYFEQCDFGSGEEKNGVLMVISLNPKACFLTAYGKAKLFFGKGDLKKYTEALYTRFNKEDYDETVMIFARESAKRLMKEKLEMPIAASIILAFAAISVTASIFISKKKHRKQYSAAAK